MDPIFKRLEVITRCVGLLLGDFQRPCLFVILINTFWYNRASMLDSSQLCSQKVPFFSWEGRRAINIGSQVSSKCFLDEP